MKLSGFDAERRNVFIIHGFNGTESKTPMTILRDGKKNVLCFKVLKKYMVKIRYPTKKRTKTFRKLLIDDFQMVDPLYRPTLLFYVPAYITK